MALYVIKRLGYAILVLIGVSIITFSILKLAPGNPARLMLSESATEQDIAELSERLGFNKPLYVQYGTYMAGVLKGDLGTSLYYKQPNTKIIFERIPKTLYLSFAALFIALILSIPLGIMAAVKKGSLIDFISMFFALIGQSMSPVWLGIVLIYVFSIQLRLLPPFGFGGIANVIMPAFALGLPMAALITRLTRAGMIEVLQEDYILAIKARGISKLKVVLKYAFKNAMLPVITVIGIQFGVLMGGAVVTEKIFSWPGVGSLAVSAIMSRDFPLVQGIMLVISSTFVLINLLVDILYSAIDPRIKID